VCEYYVAVGGATNHGGFKLDQKVIDLFAQIRCQIVVVVAFLKTIEHGLLVHLGKTHSAMRGDHVPTSVFGAATPMFRKEIDKVDVFLLEC